MGFEKEEDADITRRNVGSILLSLAGGAMGLAALTGCEGEMADGNSSGSKESPRFGTVQQAATGASFFWVDTIGSLLSPLELRGIIGTTSHVVVAGGFWALGDGGGGIFYWDANSLASDDGGTIINPTANPLTTPGRWQRIYSGPLNVKWFGAYGNGIGTGPAAGGGADDSAAISATISAATTAGGTVFLPPGTYRTTAPIMLPMGVVLQGAGRTIPGIGEIGTVILVHHTGIGIVHSNGPVTSFNRGLGKICDLNMMAVHGVSPLAAIQFISVSESSVEDCVISSGWGMFQHGVVLDGAKACVVQKCYLFPGTSGVYLTNGPSFTTGQVTYRTNGNSIRDCQFDSGQYGIVDDGGYCLTVSACNFNGQTVNSMRIASRWYASFSGCDVEAARVLLTYTTLRDNAVVNQSSYLVFSENSSLRILIVSAGHIELYRNGFSSPSLTGGINAFHITAGQNSGLALDAWPTTGAIDASGGPLGKRIQAATASPTTGTWSVGDIVWNTSPTAGGNIGWVCTTAGSPGTWKTFGGVAV